MIKSHMHYRYTKIPLLARGKIRTYNLNSFNISLNQLSFTSLEKLGIEPRLLTCKINILPIELYPLYYKSNLLYPRKDLNLQDRSLQILSLLCLPISPLGHIGLK